MIYLEWLIFAMFIISIYFEEFLIVALFDVGLRLTFSDADECSNES